MGLLTPSGSEGVQFTLPPYSHLPGLSQAERDVADLIAAAMDTPHFPEAKESHLTLCNKRIEILFPHAGQSAPRVSRRVRREQARKMAKKGR